ncbi:hypothetical protein RchiOBHm_Chr1g0329141 [Rosa chinensis]|uniref:Pentatricopeptide n=1 Tax=Rosa chinensis TaxID=74649 RepID=A0A2P6SB14_ROSCH|nr:hypothetical protein RchiOBHm_Chr1g0329141 [Rosa chinensis]
MVVQAIGISVKGVQLHGSLVKMGLEEAVFIGNFLIHFYAECGHLDYAQKVFDEMLGRNTCRGLV